MFRTRFVLAVLVAAAIVPLVGCAGRRCCGSSSYAARPVYAAPCNSCPTTAGASPVAIDP
jgi:hypothetical protein